MTRSRVGLCAALATALAAGGCASVSTMPTLKSTALVDRSRKPPLVNSLDVDPRDGSFLLTTNRGFFRIPKDGGGYRRLRSTVSATDGTTPVGTFLTVFPLRRGELLGSGHPDDRHSKLPQFLGVLASTDDGRTWRIISREGLADLHVIRTEAGRIYGFDAVLGAMLVSTDGGRNWAEHAAPRGQLMADFVVDPRDPNYLLASTEDTLFRSTDAGKTWRPLAPATTARLAWVRPGRIVRADKDGTVYESTDRGSSWRRIGNAGSEVWKLKAVSATTIYAAIGDGSIRRTTDGGKTWAVVFTP
jgi:photosystem II stability/assembly factor-like uncharacterized protein